MIYAVLAWTISAFLCALICALIYLRLSKRLKHVIAIKAPRSYVITAFSHVRMPAMMFVAHTIFALSAIDSYFKIIPFEGGRIADIVLLILPMWILVVALYLFYRDDVLATRLARKE